MVKPRTRRTKRAPRGRARKIRKRAAPSAAKRARRQKGGLPSDARTANTKELIRKVEQAAAGTDGPALPYAGALTQGATDSEIARQVLQSLNNGESAARAAKLPKRIVLIEKELKPEVIQNFKRALPEDSPLRQHSITLDPTVSFRAGTY